MTDYSDSIFNYLLLANIKNEIPIVNTTVEIQQFTNKKSTLNNIKLEYHLERWDMDVV